MFDIGFLELIIVSVIALLVLGPERMPVAVRQASVWVGKARRLMDNWSSEVNRQLDNQALQQSLKEELSLSEMSEEIRRANDSVNEALNVKSFEQPGLQQATAVEAKVFIDPPGKKKPLSASA